MSIELQSTKSNQIKLEIKDNGKGFPPDLNWQESPSLGLRLVRLLAQQLDAEINVNSNQNGTCFSLEFSPLTL